MATYLFNTVYINRGLMYRISNSPYTVAKIHERTLENVFLRFGELYRLAVAVNAVELMVKP